MNAGKKTFEETGLDNPRLQRVRDWLDTQISSNRLMGASVLIGKGGEQVFFHATGVAGSNAQADTTTTQHDTAQASTAQTNRVSSSEEQLRPFQRDTIVRLYSMTKPVTTCAAMMLYEQGHFQLDDPIAWYLPAFADMRVWTGQGELGTAEDMRNHTTTADKPITVRQLMNHTSGLTYGFMNTTPVDQYYRDEGLVFPGASSKLEALVDQLAQAPLLCQPGSQWNYSVATDVLGRLVEVWSGLSLADYFAQHIFSPLGMESTGFHVRKADTQRFADLYGPAIAGDPGSIASTSTKGQAMRQTTGESLLDAPVPLDVLASSTFLNEPPLYSGGGGLVGCADDFARFCQCLLNGGELDGERLLGRKTVEFMRKNQLPGNRDMAAMGQAVWSETSYNGIGFGLGFAVVLDPVEAGMLTSRGEHHWGGAASTFFWIDPLEDLYVILLTQLYPSSTYPLRTELRTAVYQSLV